MATNPTRAMKRLNRLRKVSDKTDLTDYAKTNMNQNWKAIEDTFSNISSLFSTLGLDVTALNESIAEINDQIEQLQSDIDNDALTSAVSGSSGSYSTTSTSYVQPTNMSIGITTSKPNILVQLVPTGDTLPIGVVLGSGIAVRVRFLRDAAQIIEFAWSSSNTFPGQMGYSYIDVGVSAGAHTYTAEIKTASGTIFFVNFRIVVTELPT